VQRYDVAVVGGGAMGAATAYHLATRGASVTLLEQYAAGHDRGSSHGRSRIFRLAYRQPHFTALARRALAAWRALEDDVAEPLLRTCGGVDHGDPRTLAEVESSLHAAQVPFDRMQPDEAQERWPGLRFTTDVVWQPDAGCLDADATVAALWRRASDLGVDARAGQRVTEVRSQHDRVEVVTDTETVRADVVVVAAGAWLPKLARQLPVDVPLLTVTQEQPGYFAAPDGDAWPVFVHYDDVPHYGLYTPDIGMKVGEHGSGAVVDPDARVALDGDAVARLSSWVEQWVPGADPTPARVDSCLYTSTPDEEFVLTRTGRVVVCSACSGHGFKFVPVVGAQVAALALDG